MQIVFSIMAGARFHFPRLFESESVEEEGWVFRDRGALRKEGEKADWES